MLNCQKILKNIIEQKIDINDVVKLYKDDFVQYSNSILSRNVKPSDPNMEAFLRICLDVYTYSATGEVLIPDSVYDKCMNIYKSGGSDSCTRSAKGRGFH